MTKYHFIIPLLIFLSACAGNSSNLDSTLSADELKENIVSTQFSIDPTKDTTIFGESGTRIFIGSNSFQFPDGTPVKETVSIQLEEYPARAHLAKHNECASS